MTDTFRDLLARPEPKDLTQIALQMLGTIERMRLIIPEITDTIRKALEQRCPTPQPPITTEQVLAQRCEILAAFVAKYGFDPDRAMQIEQRQADGTTTWRVERRPQREPEGRSSDGGYEAGTGWAGHPMRTQRPAPSPGGVVEESWYPDFADWLEREMPEGTVIGDPLWWASKIADRIIRIPTPQPLPNNYIDPEHTDQNRELLEIFYAACQSEGGTADEIHLRGIRAVIAQTQGRPGEVAELVEWLQEQEAMAYAIVDFAEARRYARAADLLRQLHQYSQAGKVDG